MNLGFIIIIMAAMFEAYRLRYIKMNETKGQIFLFII